MNKGAMLIAFFCCGVIALSGCIELSSKSHDVSNQEPLEPQGILKFSDIPIPVGFKLAPKESYSFEATGVRVGLLKYEGKADIERIVSFYKEQMSMYGWQLLNIVEYGQRLLNFDRESESCIVNITSKGSTIFLTISIGPKTQTIPKKSNKPIR